MRIQVRVLDTARRPRISLSALTIGVLVTLVLSACGQTATASIGAVSSGASPTATLGTAPTPLPTPTLQPAGQRCASLGGFDTAAGHLGDLTFKAPQDLDMYPALKLPDGIALKPLQVNGPIGSDDAKTYPPVDLMWYALDACNTSATRAHVLQSVSIRIDSFTAYTGELNATRVCATAYARQGIAGGGCGGGVGGADLQLLATLTSSTVGAVTQTTLDSGAPATSSLITIAPGYAIEIFLTIKAHAVGTLAYSVGFVVDGATTAAYPIPPTTPNLQAPIAHQWTGEACQTSAMQTLIPPATTPPTYYICPEL